METFWDLFATTVWIFLLFAFILVLFYIFSDIFRDHTMGGFAKAIWIIFLILIPPLTSLVYLIVRGKGMQQRALAEAEAAQKAQSQYIQQVAGATDPAEQIAKAKQLLDQGVIDEAEYSKLKAKALGDA
ncbi:MAG: SHOCT domain-containing protein [Candidatus Nanopelagicales bacterium]